MGEQLEIYFNTTGVEGEELKERTFRAGTQNARIAEFFLARPGAMYTAPEVRRHLGMMNAPLTSIRRSMTTLTNFNILEKTNFKREGDFGHENYCWRLKIG